MSSPPRLLLVAATRSDVLHCAPLLKAIAGYDRYALPFDTRFLVTRQEDTELDQALMSAGVEPDADLGVKTPRLADAALSAKLLEAMEQALRHQVPAMVATVGYTASAWATAVACYFKSLPLIHLNAGVVSLEADRHDRAFPEWMHARDIAGLADLHLVSGAEGRSNLEGFVGEKAVIDIVGSGAADMLQEALHFDGPEDPVFEDIPVDMPRVLIYLRRREHHANASRPLCLALNRLAAGHKDVLFFCPFSLQSHICDALEALLEPQANLLRCAPLPHAPFVREVKRAQLILTDSHGVALEGLALGRPVVMLGREALTSDLERLAVEHGGSLKVVDMEEEALVGAVQDSLNAEAAGPCDRSAISLTTNTGDRMLESIRKWWEAQT